MLASDILSRVRDQLIDTRVPYRWETAELLRWVTDGQRALVARIPDANAVYVASHALAAGARQSLPAGAAKLLSVHFAGPKAHLDTPSPTSAFTTTRMAERDQLDAVDAGWMAPAGDEPPHSIIYEPVTPKQFWVYPAPATSDAYAVALTYSKIPVAVTTEAQQLEVDDKWLEPLVDYVMFRAHSKETAYAAGLQLAQTYFERFTATIKAMETADLVTNPNLSMGPMTPETKTAAR